MRKGVRRTDESGQAKRLRRRSAIPEGLSPTLADDIGAALDALRGNRKADSAAWSMGWSPSTWYERAAEPLSLTVAELLELLVRTPDLAFGARLRGHLAAFDQHKAAAETEAAATYERLTTGQRGLPFKGER